MKYINFKIWKNMFKYININTKIFNRNILLSDKTSASVL